MERQRPAILFFFFFQAEDGIRDRDVTGVQDVCSSDLKRLLADIEAEIKPLIMPFYACDGPDGEKGKWFRRNGNKEREKTLVQTDLLNAAKSDAPTTRSEERRVGKSVDRGGRDSMQETK